MEMKTNFIASLLLLFSIIGCATIYHQQNTAVYPRTLSRKLSPIPEDFSTEFPEKGMAKQLANDVMGYWHGCTTEISDNINVELVESSPDGLDSAVLTIQSEEDPSKRYVTLAFKGSDELEDWFVNLDTDLTYPGFGPSNMQVHEGYYESLIAGAGQALVGKALQLLQNDETLEDMIYVIGYSAGGGLSSILGPYLADRYPNLPVKVITFGAPRGGNIHYKNFVNSLPNLSYWRFVFDDDVVPRTPTNLQSYYHGGHLIDINPGSAKAYYFQTGLPGVYKPAPYFWYFAISFSDHYFSNYCGYFEDDISNPSFWPTEFETV